MAKQTSIAELRTMQMKDLLGEIRTQERLVSKLRLGVKLRKEKDTAKYKSEKKQLARMRTVLAEKRADELLVEEAERRVLASRNASTAQSDSPIKQS